MTAHPPFNTIAADCNDLFALDDSGRVWRLRSRLEDGTFHEYWERVTEEVKE